MGFGVLIPFKAEVTPPQPLFTSLPFSNEHQTMLAVTKNDCAVCIGIPNLRQTVSVVHFSTVHGLK